LDLLNTYRSQLQVTIALSLIHTLYNSLQHALSLLSLLYLHRLSPGNGFQRRSFISFRVHVLNWPSNVLQVTAGRSHSQSYFTTGVYRQSVRLDVKPLETHDQRFLFSMSPCGNSPYVTSSLTRIWEELQSRFVVLITPRHGPHTKHLSHHFYYCCVT
jgi:hypothetical protein